MFTRPGWIERKTNPSSLCLGSAAYFAIVAFAAVLEMVYAAKYVISESLMNLESAAAVVSAMTFFVLPARSKGRKVLMVWASPITLTENFY